MKVPTHDELLGALEAYEVAVQEDANEGGDEAAEGLGTAREHLIGVLKACAATRTAQEPEYPTKAMLDAGLAEYDVWDAATAGIHVRKIYMAMRAATREEGK